MKKYKVREVIKLLEADGWVKLKGSGGDHRQFKHPTKKGRVTVRGHESEVLSQFLLNSIWKQCLPVCRILPGNDGLFALLSGEMLVLYDPGIGRLLIAVVHHHLSLEVRFLDDFFLKLKASIF